MIYRLGDNWSHQGVANNAISGIDTHPDDIALLERWIDEEVPEAEQTRRLVVMSIGGETTAEKVRNLAKYYKVKRSTETLSLIEHLMRESILTVVEADAFRLAHVREIS